MKKLCLAFDFDNTLAYFNDKKVGLFEIFKSLALTKQRLKKLINKLTRKVFARRLFKKISKL